MNKKTVFGISLVLVLVLVLAAGLGYYFWPEEKEAEVVIPPKEEKPAAVPSKPVKTAPQPKQELPSKKTDLYNTVDKNLPLSAIADLNTLPNEVQKTVKKLLDESCGGIYYLNSTKDKVVLVVDLTPEGEENAVKRHDFNFVEISLADGTILSQNNLEQDSETDKWKYDNDLPILHKHYNEDKELVYTEIWNYSEDESIKYKKTDKDENVISIRKEVVENGTNLREEHIFYDNEGKMVKNVSFNYDGVDLTRFTYYNSDDTEDSAMLVSEFEDGVKKKETLYSSDYHVKNIYIPEYKDGQRSEIKIFDKDNSLVETLVGD